MRYDEPILIRQATVADVPGVAQIVNDCAEFGLMLHRSHAFLYERVRDFVVAIDRPPPGSFTPAPGSGSTGPGSGSSKGSQAIRDGDVASAGRCVDGLPMPVDGRVVGVCGLSIVWANLGELYSLAVAPSHRRRGLGQRLVEACVEGARRVGVRRLMTLTYEQAFFERLGFAIVDRQTLPLKVWNECLRCSKRHACDEIAMTRTLMEVPELPAPRAGAAGAEVIEPPVVLNVSARRSGVPRPPMDDPPAKR